MCDANIITTEVIEAYIPTVEAILAVYEDAISSLDQVTAALSGEIWSDEQAKALGTNATVIGTIAGETIAAIALSDEAFDHGYDAGYEDGQDETYEEAYDEGYEDGQEDGYDEAITDLTDDDDIVDELDEEPDE